MACECLDEALALPCQSPEALLVLLPGNQLSFQEHFLKIGIRGPGMIHL